MELAETAEVFLCGLPGLCVITSRVLAHVGLCSQHSLVSQLGAVTVKIPQGFQTYGIWKIKTSKVVKAWVSEERA